MTEKKEEVKLRGYQASLVVCIIVIICLGGLFYLTYQNQLNQINGLKLDLANLISIVNMEKRTVLVRDKTVNLVANGEASFTYATPYAGYVTVEFTASGPVYFHLGSNFTNSYYTMYPTSGTATSGSFTLPIFPGTTWLYVKHPAVLIGATVTFTITYVY